MSRSDAGRKLDEVLADGKWHALEPTVQAVAVHFIPGQAHRRAEADRQGRAQRHGRVIHRERVRGTKATAVAVGQRKLANDLIGARVRRGTVERDGDRIRRRP
jgi:hypothetical protein